nr:unnamed protein product [Digitaria exilis]
MSHRSKRETAPPTPQALPPGGPWWGSAVKPGVAFPPSGEAMAIPPGWWPPPLLQSTSSFVSPYGAWMGAVPTPGGQGSQNKSNNPLEFTLGGYVSLLQNGQTSLPAPHTNPVTQQAVLALKDKNVINSDNGDEARKEKRLSWTPDERRAVGQRLVI